MPISETLKIVLGIPAIVITVLSVVARKHPDVRWLQPFNFQARLTEEQRARLRRSQNRNVGAQLALLGIIIPIGFLVFKAMFLSEISTLELVVVGLVSLACFILGVIALASNR